MVSSVVLSYGGRPSFGLADLEASVWAFVCDGTPDVEQKTLVSLFNLVSVLANVRNLKPRLFMPRLSFLRLLSAFPE